MYSLHRSIPLEQQVSRPSVDWIWSEAGPLAVSCKWIQLWHSSTHNSELFHFLHCLVSMTHYVINTNLNSVKLYNIILLLLKVKQAANGETRQKHYNGFIYILFLTQPNSYWRRRPHLSKVSILFWCVILLIFKILIIYTIAGQHRSR